MSEPTPTKTSSAAAPEPAASSIPAEAPSTQTTEMEPPKPQPGQTPTANAVPEPIEPTKTSSETDSDVKEPQNALTEKFTEAEWKALKELRKDISGVFADAYPDKTDVKTSAITLWGVKIDSSNPKDAKVSVVLMHFLRARNLSVRDAREMLVATLRWRDEFKIDEVMKEEFPADVFGNLGHIYGRDKGGRPVIYNVYGGNQDLKAVFGDVQRFLRWRVALMEQSVALLDFETVDQTVQIHDYEGVSMSSRDANSKQAASEASSIFGSHYPELLHKKFFVNVPTYLTWIFWLFKPILPAATIAKMSVVGSGPHTIGKTLLPIISEKQLPKRYGGEAEAF